MKTGIKQDFLIVSPFLKSNAELKAGCKGCRLVIAKPDGNRNCYKHTAAFSF